MNLLKKFTEDACGGAVGSGAVTGFAMPLMTSVIQRSVPPTPKIITFSSKKKQKRKFRSATEGLGLKEVCSQIFEVDPMGGNNATTTNITPDFDNTEVIAKLKSLDAKEKQNIRDTATFGLEDDNGGLVRVTVKAEQADEFENAIAGLLGTVDEDEMPEIAEVLFKLKDQFDIIDVVWPDVVEDEETDQRLEGGNQKSDVNSLGGEEGLDTNGDMDIDINADMTDQAPDDTGGDVKDMLSQVIDMMKADAEARKADAEARKAEAKNREAHAAVGQAHARVKQEEELLDMDTFNKTKKEESREAKRLAQLAKWKSETASSDTDDIEDDFGLGQSIRNRGQEEEERTVHRTQPITQSAKPSFKSLGVHRVHPHDIARYILNRVK